MGQMRRTEVHVQNVQLEAIRAWRDPYRREMDCQIIHDSIHVRPGWTNEYLLSVSGEPVGYGSVAVGGPWREAHAAYELYIAPPARVHFFDLAEAFLRASAAAAIEVQSNDHLGLMLVHAFAGDVRAESILFEDLETTRHAVDGATWRHPTKVDVVDLSDDDRRWRGVIEVDGQIAATGGVLFHYNRPYGDIYMEVLEPFRGRGLATLMVQELKRLCRESGFIPAARCNPGNLASRRALQKAGFAPCGYILTGPVAADLGGLKRR